MATSKSLVDLEKKEVFIRFNDYYQCYKVTPPYDVYKRAMEFADNWSVGTKCVKHYP